MSLIVFLPFLFHGRVRSTAVSSSLNVRENSAVNPSGEHGVDLREVNYSIFISSQLADLSN
jgi:hypothetical protein